MLQGKFDKFGEVYRTVFSTDTSNLIYQLTAINYFLIAAAQPAALQNKILEKKKKQNGIVEFEEIVKTLKSIISEVSACAKLKKQTETRNLWCLKICNVYQRHANPGVESNRTNERSSTYRPSLSNYEITLLRILRNQLRRSDRDIIYESGEYLVMIKIENLSCSF